MRSVRPLLTATCVAAALALTATGCGGGDSTGDDKDAKTAGAAASSGSAAADPASGSDGDAPAIPADLADALKKHGVDPEKWKDGGWKDWDRKKWLSEAKDFVNPVIDGLWKPERMQKATSPTKTLATQDISGDRDVTDPEPSPVRAVAEKTPYHKNAAAVGKVFFDAPEGSMVCSATVVKDPANPGRSNLVWTAGHCVHAGGTGGWYRNIAFVPAYNDLGKSAAALDRASSQEIAPYGVYWADWVSTSGEWIDGGGPTGGAGAAYDYAVMHVEPEKGGKSLEETVGTALDVDFDLPEAANIAGMGAWGYPAAAPYDGLLMHKCVDKPGRLSVSPGTPTMWRIGCTMTGGSSGGGWFATQPGGKLVLVSNTSIGPVTSGWLAGPRLGAGAEQIYTAMSDRFGGR
ncbi:trypsin-like serine peptidase [Streptomyces sp. NPDC050509]|uniref:trypsin-like serine peptidase n=1 Tax=Streptomyces sp. NPDC050509 TaxID=3365620 RepID=UPI003798DF5A